MVVGRFKRGLKLWWEVIVEAPGPQKIFAVLLGWIFAFTAHMPDDESKK